MNNFISSLQSLFSPLKKKKFTVVALLGVRNEERYLSICLQHLYEQGIETIVIDNESTDKTVEIAESFLNKGVIGIETYPYAGYYDWEGILRFKSNLAQTIDADWFIHHDADEIRQSADPNENLLEAIQRIDRQGFNAINFREFVFVPEKSQPDEKFTDYKTQFTKAYFFEPSFPHRVNAWKKQDYPVDLYTYGGHQLNWQKMKLAPENLILRHYPYLSWQHLVHKYTQQRVYSEQEVQEKGWHGKRAGFDINAAKQVAQEYLIEPDNDGWLTNKKLTAHPFLGDE
ncbi:glycosyltransferase [Thiomicrorhabdus indica]|uniref:glycosyltransferase n=1 Tax=Thiomicrorhabdus indica TaxID=2267253 RepID=UPI002AA653E3|nr:glycosyltransferase family 2 protein [Thiomicrorhabdus indica]